MLYVSICDVAASTFHFATWSSNSPLTEKGVAIFLKIKLKIKEPKVTFGVRPNAAIIELEKKESEFIYFIFLFNPSCIMKRN